MASPRPTGITYSDFRTDFLPHPITGDLVLLTNEDAVKRSVINICLTAVYERFGNPRFGAGLAAYLFENIDAVTAGQIKTAIEMAIGNYEPRAHLIEVVVYPEVDNDGFSAAIVFSTVKSLEPITVTRFLQRIR